MFLIVISSKAQVKGDIFIGAGSQLSSQKIIDLAITPMIGYQATNKLQVGLNVVLSDYGGTDYDFVQIYIKAYPSQKLNLKDNIKTFIQFSAGTSSSDNYTNIGFNVGATTFLGNSSWFYIEPSIGWSHSDFGHNSSLVGFNVTCGIRL